MKLLVFLPALALVAPSLPSQAACKGTLYLTLSTGHMEPAEAIADILRKHDEAIADILRKHDVKATFFLANEKTRRGDSSLDTSWAPYWKRLAGEGHAFGSHTWRHWTLRADTPDGKVRYAAKGTSGELLDRATFCAELRKPEDAFKAMTGRGFDGMWSAPGGRTTPRALEFARSCGYTHVAWSPAGFSGDELPSDRFPADRLIAAQLRDIRDGDVLVWHLGISVRKEPLWPRLDELIGKLKDKGFCFARLPSSGLPQ
jgi:peptidoglycan/xylan/chitin deacetylase (PgdA/CDA1 family)